MVETVRREPPPRQGYPVGRWRVADVAAALPAVATYTPSGLGRLLRRCRIRLKRGRLRQHSPDPAYDIKKASIERARALARTYPARITLLYGDEASCYRQPTLADCWFPVGDEPTATTSLRANTRHRLCGALDAVTGRVVHTTGARITVAHLKRFLHAVRTAYPDRYLFLVWDNWRVHAHPSVLAEAKRLHIRILWLPTYAPWLNPIEKLWRWLKQTVLHYHRLADRWDELKAAIAAFLARFAATGPDLLRYVGLCPD